MLKIIKPCKIIYNTDIFIYDCMYTNEEYPNHINWGHSTWQEGVKLANEVDFEGKFFRTDIGKKGLSY